MFTSENRKKLIEHRKKLSKIASISWFSSNLSGLCAVSAYNLYKEFSEHKPKILLLENGYCSHALVIVDKIIIDLTATQFGLKKYLIERRGKLKKIYPQFNRRKVFKDPELFLHHIKDWKSSRQHPSQYTL